ncbi:MAG: type II secretion system protein [Campylobacterales bacterium]|nr:type II secretion system protein [Campylobacterales bacterium]
MMKRAFSLIELIFVIVLMGVLTGIGFYYSRPDSTRQDAQYTLLKLKEARYRAIGYDAESPSTCVILTKEALSSNEPPKHEIRSAVSVIYPPDPALDSVCFDSLGRPHGGDSTTLDTLMRSPVDILFKNGDKNTTIRLYPQTGYAIIPCNN